MRYNAPMSKKIDPIHFFNERGRSVVSDKHLEDEIAKLTKENEDLKRKLTSQQLRAEFIGEPDQITRILH
jgi:hypothetical protein